MQVGGGEEGRMGGCLLCNSYKIFTAARLIERQLVGDPTWEGGGE